MNSKKAIFFVFLGALGSSSSAVLGKTADAPSFIISMYRMIFTALLLLPSVLMKHRSELTSAGWRELSVSALAGVFFSFHLAVYFESLKYTGIPSAVILISNEVMFIALYESVFLHQRLSGFSLAGVLISIAGCLIIALGDRNSGGTNIFYGDLLAILGALLQAFYTVIGKKQRSRLSTTVHTFVLYTTAALAMAVCSALTGASFTGYTGGTYLAILAMAVCCTLLGHNMYSFALKYTSSTTVSIVKLMSPILATLWGALLLRDIPGLNQYIGGAVIITGILLYILKGDRT